MGGTFEPRNINKVFRTLGLLGQHIIFTMELSDLTYGC